MIKIDKTLYVGRGHHREVYVHPDDSTLCIKIIVDGKPNDRQVTREKNYYKHLQRRGVSWEMVPRYLGDFETDLGLGSVFDLILDHDGSVSKTMEHYLSSNELTEENYEGLAKSLYLLKNYLLENRIITMTLSTRNIACKRDESGIILLSVIDNIGNSDFFPICNHVKSLAEKKILRRWNRFEERLKKAYPDNKALLKIISKN